MGRCGRLARLPTCRAAAGDRGGVGPCFGCGCGWCHCKRMNAGARSGSQGCHRGRCRCWCARVYIHRHRHRQRLHGRVVASGSRDRRCRCESGRRRAADEADPRVFFHAGNRQPPEWRYCQNLPDEALHFARAAVVWKLQALVHLCQQRRHSRVRKWQPSACPRVQYHAPKWIWLCQRKGSWT